MKIKLKDEATNKVLPNKAIKLQIKDTQNKIRTLDVTTDTEGKVELSKEEAGKLITALIGHVQTSPWVVIGESTEIKIKTHPSETGKADTNKFGKDKYEDSKKKEKSREGQY